MENPYLYHHGIKGMRWGVRRYQNRDGTLTKAGQKRYNKEMERIKEEKKVLANRAKTKKKLDRLEAARQDLENKRRSLNDGTESEVQKSKSTKRPLEDVDDNTLQKQVNRLRMENDYNTLSKQVNRTDPNQDLRDRVERLRLEKELKSLQPEHVSAGRKLVEHIGSKVVAPAATEVGKKLLTQMLSKAGAKALGLSEKDVKKATKAVSDEVKNATKDVKQEVAKAAEKQASKEAKKRAKVEAKVDKEIEDVIRKAESKNYRNSQTSESQDYVQKYLEFNGGRPIAGYLPAPKDRD